MQREILVVPRILTASILKGILNKGKSEWCFNRFEALPIVQISLIIIQW